MEGTTLNIPRYVKGMLTTYFAVYSVAKNLLAIAPAH